MLPVAAADMTARFMTNSEAAAALVVCDLALRRLVVAVLWNLQSTSPLVQHIPLRLAQADQQTTTEAALFLPPSALLAAVKETPPQAAAVAAQGLSPAAALAAQGLQVRDMQAALEVLIRGSAAVAAEAVARARLAV